MRWYNVPSRNRILYQDQLGDDGDEIDQPDRCQHAIARGSICGETQYRRCRHDRHERDKELCGVHARLPRLLSNGQIRARRRAGQTYLTISIVSGLSVTRVREICQAGGIPPKWRRRDSRVTAP